MTMLGTFARRRFVRLTFTLGVFLLAFHTFVQLTALSTLFPEESFDELSRAEIFTTGSQIAVRRRAAPTSEQKQAALECAAQNFPSDNKVVETWMAGVGRGKVNLTNGFPSLSSSCGICHIPTYLPEPRTVDINHQKDVIVAIIALGGSESVTGLVYRCVASIRRRGLWQGPIVLLTEQSFEPLKKEVFVIQIPQKELDRLSWLPGKMNYNRFKMDLINRIDPLPQFKSFSYVLYMDVDIVMGDPLDVFLEEVISSHGSERATESMSSPSNSNSYFWAFSRVKKGKGNTHGGAFLLHRRHSRACLQQWGERVTSGNFSMDQAALKSILKKEDNRRENEVIETTSCSVRTLPSKHILFPSEEDMISDVRSTLVHIPSARSKKLDMRVQKAYLHCSILLNETLSMVGEPSGK